MIQFNLKDFLNNNEETEEKEFITDIKDEKAILVGELLLLLFNSNGANK